jgi:hypothetical protein
MSDEQSELLLLLMERLDAIEAKLEACLPKDKKPVKAKGQTDGSLVWEAYSASMKKRYGLSPTPNAMQYALCKALVTRLGKEAAIKVVEHYVGLPGFYMQNGHQLRLCVKDAEALELQVRGARIATPKQAQAAQEVKGNADATQSFLESKHAQ